jgi:hypothetical protein
MNHLSPPIHFLLNSLIMPDPPHYIRDEPTFFWVNLLITVLDAIIHVVFTWECCVCLLCLYMHTRTYTGIKIFTKIPYVAPGEDTTTRNDTMKDVMDVEESTSMTPAERAAVMPLPAPEKEQRVSSPQLDSSSNRAGSETSSCYCFPLVPPLWYSLSLTSTYQTYTFEKRTSCTERSRSSGTNWT